MQAKTSRRWTEEENNVIRDNYLKLSDEEIGKMIDRTKKAVMSQRQKLKLYRPAKKQYHIENKKYKPTFDDIRTWMIDKNYDLLSDESEYKNQSSKIRYICNKHQDKGEQSVSVWDFKKG